MYFGVVLFWSLTSDRFFKKTQIEAAEAEIFRLLVTSMDQAQRTLYPTFPIIQLNTIFC